MYQYHGWFVLRESADATDLGGLEAAVAELRPLIERVRTDSTESYCGRFGEMSTVIVQGMINRPRTYPEGLQAILDFLATRLPGSYGYLYEGDDERQEPPGGNAFRVRTLTRGSITEVDDPFFSPREPVIEDPFE